MYSIIEHLPPHLSPSYLTLSLPLIPSKLPHFPFFLWLVLSLFWHILLSLIFLLLSHFYSSSRVYLVSIYLLPSLMLSFLQFSGTTIFVRLRPLWLCFLSTSSPTLKTYKTACLSVTSHKLPLQYLVCVFKSFLCSFMCCGCVCVCVMSSGSVCVFLMTTLQNLSCWDIT